jgi:hypothetical protein
MADAARLLSNTGALYPRAQLCEPGGTRVGSPNRALTFHGHYFSYFHRTSLGTARDIEECRTRRHINKLCYAPIAWLDNICCTRYDKRRLIYITANQSQL